MRPTVTPLACLIMAGAACVALFSMTRAEAGDYAPVPGLSAQDRAVLAASMAKQGQCKNAMVEVDAAIKEMPEDELLIRIKGTCETEMGRPEAKDTVMKWLKMAPQNHPERGRMLALLAKTQAAKELALEWVPVPAG